LPKSALKLKPLARHPPRSTEIFQWGQAFS
jgi:hypothetical protein